MPRYRFEIEGDDVPDEAELPNDEAAWGELVTWCGELLRDLDGSLPERTELRLQVSEADRHVAAIQVTATRGHAREDG